MNTDDLRKRAREEADRKIPASDAAQRERHDASERTILAWERAAFINGYLAHATQQPSREQIARAIERDDEQNQKDGKILVGIEPYESNADAVLRLMNGEDVK